MTKLYDPRTHFEGFGLSDRSDAVTVEDFAAFVAALRASLDPSAPAAGAVLAALDDCEAAITNDAEAELVRKGFRLGAWLAVAERDRYYRGVHRLNRRRGQQTKAQRTKQLHERIREEYRRLEPKLGDLEARRHLRDKYDRTLETITNIVRLESE